MCGIELNRSADVGLLKDHGLQIRDVYVERDWLGGFVVFAHNEFTGDEIPFGYLEYDSQAFAHMNSWLDFEQKYGFMAIYLDEWEVVIIDFYLNIFI